MSTLATIIQHGFGSPSHGNQRRKRNANWKRSKTYHLQMMLLYTGASSARGSSSWKEGGSTCSLVSPPVNAAINPDRCWGNYLWTKNSSRQTGEGGQISKHQ